MLPEVLSNGLCSLKPEVDRLCMVCELYVSREGKITRSRFFEGVMRSQARLTYDEVAAMLVDGDPVLVRQHKELLPHLLELYALYRTLHAERAVRGAIDFDTTETRILFNSEQKVERIVPLQRNDAHRLIEECMLVANVAAARFLLRKRLPALYRIHEGPPDEKLLELRAVSGGTRVAAARWQEAAGKGLCGLAGFRTGPAGCAPHSDGFTAFPVPGRLQLGECGALRAGLSRLYPFYLADPALSGSDRPPCDQAPA